MLPHEIAAQASIKALYGAPISYFGAGLSGSAIVAIRSDTRAAIFQGFDGKSNGLSFEIDKGDLPGEPDKSDQILESDGARWAVIDINDRDDVNAWVLWVEEAA